MTCTSNCRTLCVTFTYCCLEAQAQPSPASGTSSDGSISHLLAIKWATRWYGFGEPVHRFPCLSTSQVSETPVLTEMFACDTGVLAGGGASASSDPPPPGGAAADRHAAAPLQSRPGEEALSQHEASHLCHPGEAL